MANKIKVNLVHPTNPSETLSVSVPHDSTAKWLVSEMEKAGFIQPAGNVGKYALVDTRTNAQMNENQTLAAAGVQDGANLQVRHATTGASVVAR